MLTVYTTEREALALLVAVAAHAGPRAELGHPIMAGDGWVLTTLGDATAVLSLDNKSALRTVELPTGAYEVTRYRDGVEISRIVDLAPPRGSVDGSVA